MAYVIENLSHCYLQSPFIYVENIEFARVFSTADIAVEYMLYLGLDSSLHRIVYDENLEPDEAESDFFEEKLESPYDK